MGCYYHYPLFHETRPFSTDVENGKRAKKTFQDEMRRDYVRQKVAESLRCGIVSSGVSMKLMHQSKVNPKKLFTYKRPSSEKRLRQRVNDGKIFGYSQCDIEVPQRLRRYFPNFPPLLNTFVFRNEDNGPLIKEYAEKENIMVQPGK